MVVHHGCGGRHDGFVARARPVSVFAVFLSLLTVTVASDSLSLTLSHPIARANKDSVSHTHTLCCPLSVTLCCPLPSLPSLPSLPPLSLSVSHCLSHFRSRKLSFPADFDSVAVVVVGGNVRRCLIRPFFPSSFPSASLGLRALSNTTRHDALSVLLILFSFSLASISHNKRRVSHTRLGTRALPHTHRHALERAKPFTNPRGHK